MDSHFQGRSCGRSPAQARLPRSTRRAVSLAAALLMGLSTGGTAYAQAAQPAEWVKGRLVLQTRAGLPDTELAAILKPHGGKSSRIGKTDLFVVDLPAGMSEQAVLSQLEHNPHLKFAELDAIVKPAFAPNDPYFGSEWHLATIGAPLAWDRSQGTGVVIAVLDTGVDASHPDLAARIVPGWNVYDNNSNTADVTGHGTAVAGTAAASMNNGAGVAGVAGAARIMPMRICDLSGNATGSNIARAITYAADHGARVANISFGGVPGNSTVQTAAQYMKSKGGLVVVAAGNNGINENITPSTTMISVSAVEKTDVKTTWSSYGSFVTLAAPGNTIWTTTRGGGYGQWWGTSFASPVVAGTVALLMAARPDLPNTAIESLLTSTAVDLGTAGRDIYYGYGRVNAAAAVSAAVAGSGTSTTSDTQAPAVAITAPTGGASVSGVVPVNISASDNVGVTRVELRVNGGTVATDTSSPFAFSWDSRTIANGSASLTAYAFDAAGNSKASSAVAVGVSNSAGSDTSAPTVQIIGLANGARVSGTVAINVSASDNAGAAGITQTLYVDGGLRATGTGASLSYSWNTTPIPPGNHTIKAVGRDAAGNQTATTIWVTR